MGHQKQHKEAIRSLVREAGELVQADCERLLSGSATRSLTKTSLTEMAIRCFERRVEGAVEACLSQPGDRCREDEAFLVELDHVLDIFVDRMPLLVAPFTSELALARNDIHRLHEILASIVADERKQIAQLLKRRIQQSAEFRVPASASLSVVSALSSGLGQCAAFWARLPRAGMASVVARAVEFSAKTSQHEVAA
ncbi:MULTISPECIES: hypothetical protein [Pacificimonas]|uniref:TetR family transcriptional regulator n=1 Tax=Pacificimonas aurantium TaxID=1250540 RepID=A0ABS7WMA8_9SPHN|nr:MULTISPECIES: hypothetical protein [Pacificimonas]MBZ6379521.1 hypothetical protein [Pacificimonas aurantium]